MAVIKLGSIITDIACPVLVRLNVVPPILPAMSVTIEPNLMTAINLIIKLKKKGSGQTCQLPQKIQVKEY